MDIKHPEIQFSVKTGTMIRQPLNGSIVRSVNPGTWPNKRKFRCEFQKITRTEKDALIALILASWPLPYLEVDSFEGTSYGIYVMGDISINQDKFYRTQAGCTDATLYNVSFTAEGVEV